MNRTTEELIAALDRIEWFSRAGMQDIEPAKVLSSWKQAIASATDGRLWESFLLDRRAELTVFLHKHAMDRYRKWNEIAIGLKKVVEPMVSRKMEPIMAAHDLPKVFEHCVRWDILGACMEQEYSELRPSAFYTEMAGIYLAGHFPCGWEGPYPSGVLIVY